MTIVERLIISDDLIEWLAAREAYALELLAIRTKERDSWRLMSLATMLQNVELTQEMDMLTRRERLVNARLQDERDVWLDQRDLREEASCPALVTK